ncbi:MAG: glutamate-5-semialdehyde dehydrogenase [Elusimicrobia bacterium]|nr:glutamate-5-semialdehyde dehydrogenase [Elusimicrobiota bacterium]
MKKNGKSVASKQKRVQTSAPSDYTAELIKLCAQAKEASRILAGTSLEQRNRALTSIAETLEKNKAEILFRNEIDLEAGRRAGLSPALLDRLALTDRRVMDMAQGLREVAVLSDPLAENDPGWDRPSGLRVQKVRVPLGVIAMIYEARPNVTVDATSLCLKSGNAVVLRGGKEAVDSNTLLVHLIKDALGKAGLPRESVQFVGTTDRSVIRDLVRMEAFVDLVIPRGGEEMVNAIREMATVPVLSHGKGLCSVYVDQDADLDMAERIVLNSKIQRPAVCNAMETLLVHRAVGKTFVPRIVRRLAENRVTVRGDLEVQTWGGAAVTPAVAADFDTEFLGLELAMKAVESVEEAVTHINAHGSHHSDAIVTANENTAQQFLARVDSAAVFHNASTRLHDGSALGLGSEMGISTQKLHARGTMGLRELTTTKYIVRGDGHIRE